MPAETFVASISLTYKICGNNRFFFLTEEQMVMAEKRLVSEVRKIFPPALQKKWGNIPDAPVQEWRGLQSIPLIKRFLDHHLAELTSPLGPQQPVMSAMRDDECWICEIIKEEHICRRCSDLFAGGAPLSVSTQTPLGEVRAALACELKFNCDRYLH